MMFEKSNLKVKKGLFILWMGIVNFCYAQGPTAPEASSFEPVEATDMVELLTGDLSYVMPVLNVPSPEGGYSLALSYHGGIAMDQESSWIGLGWNINPGAINRSVLGYPDDWKREKVSKLIYDAGGEIISNGLSISVGWGDGLYSAGLYSSWGSNRSINGENSSYSHFGAMGTAYGFSGSVGTDGIGLGLGFSQSFGIGNSNGFTGNFNGGIGLNYGWDGSINGKIKFKATGASLENESGNSSTGISAEGSFSFGKNKSSTSGAISITGKSTSYSLNVNNVLRISYTHAIIKYWLAQKRTSEVVGTLYASYLEEMLDSSLSPERQDFDSYEVLNDVKINNSYNNNNLSFLAKDSYNVNAQGISGNISPSFQDFGSIHFERKITENRGRLSVDENTYSYKYNFTKSIDKGNLFFYFDNEYSSYLALNTSGTFNQTNNAYPSMGELIDDLNVSDFNLNTVYSDPNGEEFSNYNPQSKRIVKGSFIETYTNKQINNSNAFYFKDVYKDRDSAEEDGIGAFIITKMDGIRYLYTIPVYQKEKFDRIGNIESDIENNFYEEQSLTPYATHWLLTAIIGPDYVDANFNSEIDEGDFGYWTTFDYGKWSDGFVWRTPTTDFQESNSSKKYSWGIKEIYYLDKIKTRTHTAFFIKDLRMDGQSNTEVQIGSSRSNPRSFQEVRVGYDPKIDLIYKNGLFYFESTYDTWSTNDITLGGCSLWNTNYEVTNNYFMKTHPHKQLRLNRILLIQNDFIPFGFNKESSGRGEKTVSEIYITEKVRIENDCGLIDHGTQLIHDKNYKGEYSGEIYDMEDYNLYENEFKENSERIVNFVQDYSSSTQSPNANTGKLTLKKVQNISRGDSYLIPPYKFNYYFGVYNRNIDDWGYSKPRVESNSLSSIETPLGSIIKIHYEEDDFHQSASRSKRLLSNGLMFFVNCSSVNDDIILEITNDLDVSTNELDSFFSYFESNETTNLSLFICRKERYGGHRRQVSLNLDEISAQVLAVTNESVTLKISGNSDYWYEDHQNLGWITGRKWSKSGVYHNNGNPDGVIIRNDAVDEYTCYQWRSGGYQNSDVTIFYDLVSSTSLKDQEGGGLRVKDIEVTDGNSSYRKEYFYNEPGFDMYKDDLNYRSSGITSYAPSKYPQIIPYQTELPSPYVIYKNVAVKSDEITTYYTFNVLKPLMMNGDNISMGNIINIDVDEQIEVGQHTTGNFQYVLNKKNFVVKDNLSSIGSIIEMESKNNENQTLLRKKFNYKLLNSESQGINIESFNTYELVFNRGEEYINLNANITSKIKFPNVLESIETIQKGVGYKLVNIDFDFNTGLTLESITSMSDGTENRTSVIPAYKVPEYSGNVDGYGMGSKADNNTNKNMLSQVAVNYTFIKNNDIWKPIGVGLQTWRNSWSYRDISGVENTPTIDNHKVWRKHKTFVWDGDIDANGVFIDYDIETDDGFNWQVNPVPENQPEPWKQISEITRYDHFSSPLELQDINNNFAASKTWHENTKTITSGNVQYNEMFSSSAEYQKQLAEILYLGQEITTTEKQNFDKSHTGNCSIGVSPNRKAFQVIMKRNEHRTGIYKISVWVYKENYQDARIVHNGNSSEFKGEKVFAGNWVQMNHYLDLKPNTEETIYLTSAQNYVYFDDFRLNPIGSSINSFVYNEWGELTFLLGSNNMGTKYQYDEAGRLIRIYEEIADTPTIPGGFKLAKEYRYNYKSENGNGGGGDCDFEVEFYEVLTNSTLGPSTAKFYFPTNGALSLKFEVSKDPSENRQVIADFDIYDYQNNLLEHRNLYLSPTDVHNETTIELNNLTPGEYKVYNEVSNPQSDFGVSTVTLQSATPASVCIGDRKSFDDQDRSGN